MGLRDVRRHKFRRLLMTAKDEAIFSEALRDSFPTVKFLQEIRPGEPFLPSIADAEAFYVDIFVPDDERWIPKYVQTHEGDWFSITNGPPRQLRFRRSTWEWNCGLRPDTKWAFDPPTLEEGFTDGGYRIGDPRERELAAFLREVWRILNRITTNRLKGGHPLGNELMGGDRVLMADGPGWIFWAGHHALEWCREGPRLGKRRMLTGRYRPRDDWEPPGDPWYRDLVARVEARYGRDFGDPTIAD